jgi:hypothetical protein
MGELTSMSYQHRGVAGQQVLDWSDKRVCLAEIQGLTAGNSAPAKGSEGSMRLREKTDRSGVPDQIGRGILLHEFPSRVFLHHAIGLRLVAGRPQAIPVCSFQAVGELLSLQIMTARQTETRWSNLVAALIRGRPRH